jgi:hypothetical protein
VKTISILAALTVFGCGLPSAQAGLLGMPMHLKSVAERVELNKQPVPGSRSSDFFTDGVPPSLQIISC